jgi:hypothetical protein
MFIEFTTEIRPVGTVLMLVDRLRGRDKDDRRFRGYTNASVEALIL